MKKSLDIQLNHVFEEAVSSDQVHLSCSIPMNQGTNSYWKSGSNEAILQEFDGLLGYLYHIDLQLSNSIAIPIQVDKADLHVFYLLASASSIQIWDEQNRIHYSLAPKRACYFYLPVGRYTLILPRGKLQLFGFYFRGAIFRQDNERPFLFLHTLLAAYRENSPISYCSLDFRNGPRTHMRIRHLLKNLHVGQLNTEEVILRQIKELILLSKEKIFEEYEQHAPYQLLAEKIYRSIFDYCQEHGQKMMISQLLEEYDLSQQYVNMLLKQHYGWTIKICKYKIIIDLSKDYLSEGKSITETAYELNYNNVHHFSYFFKEQTGLSPTQYLEQLKTSID